MNGLSRKWDMFPCFFATRSDDFNTPDVSGRAGIEITKMTTGYSTLTRQDASREIKAMRRVKRKIAKSPARVRAFLIKAGFLTKSGKKLAAKYR